MQELISSEYNIFKAWKEQPRGKITMKKRLDKYRKQTAEIIDVRTGSDWVSHLYDFVYIFLIIANLTVSVLLTYDRIRAQ